MRKLSALAITIGLVALLSGPSFAQSKKGGGPATGPFEFVGYTSVTTVGDATPPGMNALCQDDFGSEFGDENVRACTTREWVLSPSATIPPGLGAWVVPERVGGAAASTGSADLAGIRAVFGLDNDHTNCRGWTDGTSASSSGVAIDGADSNVAGRILLRGCGDELRITCCARQ